MPRFDARQLAEAGAALLTAGGMDPAMSALVAQILVEGDLLGHPTHGIGLLPDYLRDLSAGTLNGTGTYTVLRDTGPTALWDGNWLSGVWLTATAVDVASDKAAVFGVGVVSVRHSHHNACLQAYLRRATERGMVVTITSSDPTVSSVAPYGGRQPVFSPDPIAVGIPTPGDPILVDMSSSITTNGMIKRLTAAGGRLPHPWLIDKDGAPTDDPTTVLTSPPGALLPTGGLDHGHKGYGLALTVESLTQGLSGYGRGNATPRWTSALLVQVFDPDLFAGADALLDRTGQLVELCHAATPLPGVAQVRLPGERSLEHRRRCLAAGVEIDDDAAAVLRSWADRYAVALPQPSPDAEPA